MTMLLPLLLLAAPAVAADQRRDQEAAWAGAREGRLMPLKEIERRIVPTVSGAQYLGVDFDPGTAVYTLKFLRNGHVIWIDVDGRTGQVVGRSGH